MHEKDKYLALMQRYFEAQTTPEEELALARYAASSPDPAFDPLRGVLGFLSIGRQRRERKVRRALRYYSVAAAAGLALVVSAGIALFTRYQNSCSLYAYGEKITDKEEILTTVEASLADFFSDGTSAEANLSEMFNR